MKLSKKKKKMPNLTRFTQKKIKKCVLEDGFRDSCSENFVKFCFADKYPWVTEFTVKQVTVYRVAIFFERDAPANGNGFIQGWMKFTKWIKRTKNSTLSWEKDWLYSSSCISSIIKLT